jgi:hypothetical protein
MARQDAGRLDPDPIQVGERLRGVVPVNPGDVQAAFQGVWDFW